MAVDVAIVERERALEGCRSVGAAGVGVAVCLAVSSGAVHRRFEQGGGLASAVQKAIAAPVVLAGAGQPSVAPGCAFASMRISAVIGGETCNARMAAGLPGSAQDPVVAVSSGGGW